MLYWDLKIDQSRLLRKQTTAQIKQESDKTVVRVTAASAVVLTIFEILILFLLFISVYFRTDTQINKSKHTKYVYVLSFYVNINPYRLLMEDVKK